MNKLKNILLDISCYIFLGLVIIEQYLELIFLATYASVKLIHYTTEADLSFLSYPLSVSVLLIFGWRAFKQLHILLEQYYEYKNK